MDKAKIKKRRNLRIIATNIFMGVAIIAIAGALTLFAMGYSLNRNGALEQSGLVQVKSSPSGATVHIDGVSQFSRTEMSKMLKSGNHSILVTKSGYDNWETNIDVEAGLLTRIDWVRLFPLNKTIENVHEYSTPRLVSASPDSHYLLVLEEGETVAELVNIRNDEVKYTELDFARILGLDGEAIEILNKPVILGQLNVKAWNANNDKFLLQWVVDDAITWILVDAKKPENSVNLTSSFLIDFTDVQIADDAATKLWVTESGSLRLIRVEESTISNALAANVKEFYSNGATVAYLGTNKKGKNVINIYKDGEKGSTTIQTISEDIETVSIVLGTSWKADWIAYALNNRLFVRAGKYPSYQGNSTLSTIAENDLEFTPTNLIKSPSNRFVVASKDDNLSVVDTEIEQKFDYTFANTGLNWLDNYILWSGKDSSLSIIDFNGQNQREITNVAPGLTAVITHNNRWLYYFAQPNATDKESTEKEKQPTFILHRERL